MKKLIFIILCLFCSNLFGQNIPKMIPNSFVQDHANVLNENDRKEIDSRLREFKNKYDLEFGVATISNLEGYPVEMLALKMAREYGIGTKDNEKRGLLLLLAVNDRKWRFEISRHMEPFLTDGQSGTVGRNVLVPKLKIASKESSSANWKDAILSTVSAVDVQVSKTNEAEVKSPVSQSTGNIIDTLVNILIFLMIIGGLGGAIFYFYRRHQSKLEAEEREQEQEKQKEYLAEQERKKQEREAYLKSPAGIAETNKKIEQDKKDREEREKREKRRKEEEAQERIKYQKWANSAEGKRELKRQEQVRKTQEEEQRKKRKREEEEEEERRRKRREDDSYSNSSSYSSSSSSSSYDSSSSSSSYDSGSSSSFGGGSDFGGGGSSGDW